MDSFEIEEEEIPKEVMETPQEKLFYFLYKLCQHHCHPNIGHMFSWEVSMEDFILSRRSSFQEKEQQLFTITGNGGMLIKEDLFFHINDRAPIGLLRSKINRFIIKVPIYKKKLDKRCRIHNGNFLFFQLLLWFYLLLACGVRGCE